MPRPSSFILQFTDMKKVLIFFSGSEFSEGAFSFARRLNDMQSILLVGVFIPKMSYASLWGAIPYTGYEFVPLLEPEINGMKTNISRFETECRENSIGYHIHSTLSDYSLEMLKKETRFGDLLIISSDKFYEDTNGAGVPSYLQEVLHAAECPVIVVPEKFDFPTSNIFAYDGGESSVFAIRQFLWLFPEFSKNDSSFVYVKEGGDLTIPDEEDIREYAEPHLAHAEFLHLGMPSGKSFSSWVSQKKEPILIGGAYDRSGLSELFKKSFFNEVIAERLLPVFIAHK